MAWIKSGKYEKVEEGKEEEEEDEQENGRLKREENQFIGVSF